MRRRRGRAAFLGWAVVLGVTLGAAGCGEGGAPEACGLLSDADAERILDTPTRPGESDDDDTLGPGTECAWISTDSTRDPEAAVYGLSLWLRDDDGARAEFARRRNRLAEEFVAVDVAGLGDDAYFIEDTEPNSLSGVPSLPTLYVRAGDRVVGIGVFDSDERPVDAERARAMERAAARAALDRLN